MAEKKFIEREVALKKIDTAIGEYAQHGEIVRFIGDCRASVIYAPAADVVEVVHARFEWGFQNGQYGIWCTRCGAGWVDSENAEWIAHSHDYCPKCGAKMRNERKCNDD